MDERKRGFDVAAELNDQKRPRPSGDPSADVVSRICLSRGDFAKVIGKGGQTIAGIRAKCGAGIKGTEVSEEKRLLLISGSFAHVVEAFDLVSELLYTNHMHTTPNDPFTFHVMIEHAKAGRVVGPKGSNIQALKSRSGAAQVRVVKDPEDMNGLQLREILIEGSLHAIRRVHFHILELFYEINLMVIAASGTPIHRGSTLYEMITSQSNMVPQSFGAPPGFMGNSSASRSSVIPINNLQSIGLHADVVTRLRELQSYLNQFGLDLQVLDSRTQMPSIGFPTNEYHPHHPHSSPHNMSLTHSLSTGSGAGGVQDGLRKLEFYIPRETVGGIIGRGGQGLRDLMHETGCKIYIDKNESDGSRLVRVISNVQSNGVEEEANLQFAKDVILKRVNEIKETHGEELDA